MFIFKKKYFLLSCLLFLIEILIALYFNDRIIRPYIGDLLVVIMIYCFIRTFYNSSVVTTALGVLLFSYVVEILQYFKLINYLGLQHSTTANLVLGHSFEWMDIAAYTAGFAIVLFLERVKTSRRDESQQ